MNINELLKHNFLTEAKKKLNSLNPIDITSILDNLSTENTLKAFRILSKNLACKVFANLSAEKQQEIIEATNDDELKLIIESMFLDDTVDLIEEMPAGVVNKILKNSSLKRRKMINQFLNYPQDSAGGIMTVEYLALHTQMTIKEALKKIRINGIYNEMINDCFILGKERVLEGIIPIKKLLINEEETLLKDIMTKNFKKVTVHTDQEVVAALFKKYDLTTMPVVDNEERLVGVITVDDIVDIIYQEHTEDFQKMAAIKPSNKEYLKESALTLAKHRILWLLILMVSATITGNIVRKHAAVLQSVVILAAFIPMLMDTGGNAGSQSSTLIIRGLALGEIKTRDLYQILWKEFKVGLIVATTLGVINFFKIIYFDKIELRLTIVICFSLFITIILAKLVGCVLPIFAKILKLDPAIMAAPLITTIVDAGALSIYFYLASWMLSL